MRQPPDSTKSTGPRTQAGKARARLNALKRTFPAGSFKESMIALGEDPEEYSRLYRDLLAAYEPADRLWAKQVEDLAQLYWRRARLERAKDGIVREKMERLERERLRRRRETDRIMQGTPVEMVMQLGLRHAEDSPTKFKEMLSHLENLLDAAERRDFSASYQEIIEMVFGRQPTWQACKITQLFSRFARLEASNPPPDEGGYQELVDLLRSEVCTVHEDFQLFMREHGEVSAAARDACLAPSGRNWNGVIRQENGLDRAIDRKVRILLALRRNWERQKARIKRHECPGKAEIVKKR